MDQWIVTASLVGLGLTVGLFGGLLGLGGGWLVVPALNIMGYPITTCVGTSLAQMVGTSAVAAFQHYRLGNLLMRLSLALVVPMLVGVQVGKQALFLLDQRDVGALAVRVLYLFVLGGIGTYSLLESVAHLSGKTFRITKRSVALPSIGPRLRLSPELSVSWLAIIGLGFLAGMLSGILGLGGGILLVPALYYMLSVSTVSAAASTSLCKLIASLFGAIGYGMQGFVDALATLTILAGSIIGSYVGAILADRARGAVLRLCFAFILITTWIATLLRQLELEQGAQVVLFGGVPLVTLIVIAIIIKGKSP